MSPAGNRPQNRVLAERHFVVTRPERQAGPLVRKLEALGARVTIAPTIRIEPPADEAALEAAIARARDYDWIVFTSANAVDAFFEHATTVFGTDFPNRIRFAAVGPATAEALETRGLHADVVPERHVADDVFRALRQHTELSGLELLLPRADIAREALPKLLAAAGARVDTVAAYRTVTDPKGVGRAVTLVRGGGVDAVTFTSASTVGAFLSGADEATRARLVPASIGPITSGALREAGLEPVIEAARSTAEGLVEAIVGYFRKKAKEVRKS